MAGYRKIEYKRVYTDERLRKLEFVTPVYPRELRMQLHPGTCSFPELGLWGKITVLIAGTRHIAGISRSLPGSRVLASNSEEQAGVAFLA